MFNWSVNNAIYQLRACVFFLTHCLVLLCSKCLTFCSVDCEVLRACFYMRACRLEICGFTPPYANHFRGYCESLWLTDSQYFWVTVNHFWPIANRFCQWIRKDLFGLHPFFREALCNKERNNSANKLRINLKKWFAICGRTEKLRITFWCLFPAMRACMCV